MKIHIVTSKILCLHYLSFQLTSMICPLLSLYIHPAISFLCCFLLAAAEQWASIKIILVWKCSKKFECPIRVKEYVTHSCFRYVECQSVSHLVVSDPLWLHGLPWDSRHEYWSELLFPITGDLPDPGMESWYPAFQADSLPSEPPSKPCLMYII